MRRNSSIILPHFKKKMKALKVKQNSSNHKLFQNKIVVAHFINITQEVAT